MRKIVIGTGIAVAVVVVLMGALYLIVAPTFRQPPAARFPRPASIAEANRQDLEYLERLPEIDRSFTPRARARFASAVKTLLGRAATLDRAQLVMGVARAAAMAGNGHTNEIGPAKGYDLNSIPLRLSWFKEGLFVVAADPADGDLLGARVDEENDETPADLTRRLDEYVGGNEAYKKDAMPFLLESPAALHASGCSPSAESVSLVLTLTDGARVARTIAAVPEPVNGQYRLNQARIGSQRYLSPVPIPGDGRKWVHVLDGHELPLFLRHPDVFYWDRYLDGRSVLYVQLNAVRNQNGSLGNGLSSKAVAPVAGASKLSLPAFLQGILHGLKDAQTRAVIVDLRFNAGGNSELTYDFARKLPVALGKDGRIFILTSANTFSAGLITAAWLKYYGRGRAVLVGQRMGDNEEFWAEGAHMILPNSRIVLDYATAFHDWKHGCSWSQVTTCFFYDYVNGVAAGSLSPTMPVENSFTDYAAGRDTVMMAVAAQLHLDLVDH